jgi:hypothetical protein
MSGAETAPMTRSDRENLSRLIRQQAKLGKTEAAERAAELRADFEKQLDRHYHYDEEPVWAEAHAAAEHAVKQAQASVAQRCVELGIPEQFRPRITMHWYDRGRNALKSERAEMRKVGFAAIAALERRTRTEIDRAALQLETELVSGTLTSDAGHAFLARLPQARRLMAPIDVKALAG